ncbi:hypothetical protein XELAEV_18045111mg, partial [Xenopus laevis]
MLCWIIAVSFSIEDTHHILRLISIIVGIPSFNFRAIAHLVAKHICEQQARTGNLPGEQSLNSVLERDVDGKVRRASQGSGVICLCKISLRRANMSCQRAETSGHSHHMCKSSPSASQPLKQ